jgi:hypothetical protein
MPEYQVTLNIDGIVEDILLHAESEAEAMQRAVHDYIIFESPKNPDKVVPVAVAILGPRGCLHPTECGEC